MDVAKAISQSSLHAISSIEMHTTGEPVRIIYDGYPELTGTLMEQRKQAKLHHDVIRRRLMLEPRGHNEMLVMSLHFICLSTSHLFARYSPSPTSLIHLLNDF
jgi:proline racemase